MIVFINGVNFRANSRSLITVTGPLLMILESAEHVNFNHGAILLVLLRNTVSKQVFIATCKLVEGLDRKVSAFPFCEGKRAEHRPNRPMLGKRHDLLIRQAD